MTTTLAYINPETGMVEFENEEETNRSLFVEERFCSGYVYPDTSVLGWNQNTATEAYVKGELTYEQFHLIMEKLGEESRANGECGISYVDNPNASNVGSSEWMVF